MPQWKPPWLPQRLPRRPNPRRGSRPPAQHPAGDDRLPPAGNAQLAGTDVIGDGRPGRDVRAVTDPDRRDERAVGADEGVLADLGAMLGHPVVIGGDHPGADVAARADARVADIGKVRHLGSGAHDGVLDLDERSDLGAVGQHRARPEEGERADRGARADPGADAVRPGDGGAGADSAAGQGGVRTDGRPGRDGGAGLQGGAGQQGAVGGQFDVGVDPGRRRVEHGHPGQLRGPHQPLVEPAAQVGQLDPVVDALGLRRIRRDHGAHRKPVGDGQGHDVGQVALTGGVRGGQPGERRGQHGAVEGVHPRVDLPDRPDRVVGIPVLDDRPDPSGTVAYDPPVAGGVGHLRGEHGDGVMAPVVGGHQRPKGVRGEK